MIVGFAIICAAAPASAQPGAWPDAARSPVEIHRYGLLTLGVDALSVGTVLIGGVFEGPGGEDTALSQACFWAGLTGMTLAAPLVHVVRNNGRAAAFSLILRATVPVVTASVAVATARCDGLLCELDRLGPGFLVGTGLVAFVDATLLAHQELPARPPALAPIISIGGGGAQLGVAAAF